MKTTRNLLSGFTSGASKFGPVLVAWVVTSLCPESAMAYPPAPYHTISGLVRDELGEPLMIENAQLILETSAGVQIKTMVVPNLAPGVNYQLKVPMDAGLTSDAYKPTALRPLVPFRLKVKVGNTVYLPMEMTAGYSALGKPAQQTRLDLTLGEDSNGDGLPDAWQYAVIAALGGKLTLTDITPGGDADGDGISNLDEYLAGTYAFDPNDGFRLDIVGFNGPNALLEFLAIRGHSYSLQVSTDLKSWSAVQFQTPGETESTVNRDSYQASDVRILRVEVAPPEGQPPLTKLFFKARVQEAQSQTGQTTGALHAGPLNFRVANEGELQLLDLLIQRHGADFDVYADAVPKLGRSEQVRADKLYEDQNCLRCAGQAA